MGAALFGLCTLGPCLTIPRPDMRVINASGQSVTVAVRGATTQTLNIDRIWAVNQDFGPGTLHFRMKLPDQSEVSTALA